MSAAAGEEYYVVAAIDFGTTFSGYAFSFKSNPKDIIMNRNWESNGGLPTYKTPTVVLVKPNGEFAAFGYEAEKMYSDLDVKGKLTGYQMFRHFKLLLHRERLTRHIEVESTVGFKRNAMDIFVMALYYLSNHLLTAINKSTTKLEQRKIKWVITVPAIWSDDAKQFMREAAHKADLIDKVDSQNLCIALEPEAASLFCRSLNWQSLSLGESGERSITFKEGTKFLIIDAGGGTIDIAAHEVLPDGHIKELLVANGGDLGGKKIDERFINLIEQVLGSDFVNTFRTSNPMQWLHFITKLEQLKVGACTYENKSLKIPLPWSMESSFKKLTNKNIEDKIKESAKLGVSLYQGSLLISHKAQVGLFQPVTDKIIKLLKEISMEEALCGCEHYLLIGGFGECEFLQKALQDNFRNISTLVPFEAQISVLRGAVSFGFNPSYISIRKARWSYGISYLTDFNWIIHDKKHLVTRDNKHMCRDLFAVFIQKGDDIEVGHLNKHRCSPSREAATDVAIPFYRANNLIPPDQIIYTDLPGFTEVGLLVVPVKDQGQKREVEVELCFGGTEICVKGRDCNTGETVSITIDFLKS